MLLISAALVNDSVSARSQKTLKDSICTAQRYCELAICHQDFSEKREQKGVGPTYLHKRGHFIIFHKPAIWDFHPRGRIPQPPEQTLGMELAVFSIGLMLAGKTD